MLDRELEFGDVEKARLGKYRSCVSRGPDEATVSWIPRVHRSKISTAVVCHGARPLHTLLLTTATQHPGASHRITIAATAGRSSRWKAFPAVTKSADCAVTSGSVRRPTPSTIRTPSG